MHELALSTLNANEAVIHLTSRLSEAGYQVTRSFDLQAARAELRAPEECPCPHHGSAACTCQYVVLLVNRPREAPATLVIHGHDDQTNVSLERRQDGSIPARLEEALRSMAPDLADAPEIRENPADADHGIG
ncbi:MAG: hypothetical protein BMS9Abin28_1657 [Anaerolineae bacterium]|nr:MAG: hypothetical protein BMS9Abin28_1657 [Anaerolineae bacterium]